MRVLSPQYFNPLLSFLWRDKASWALLRGHATSNINALILVSNTTCHKKMVPALRSAEGRRKAVRLTSDEGRLACP